MQADPERPLPEDYERADEALEYVYSLELDDEQIRNAIAHIFMQARGQGQPDDVGTS